MTTAVLRVTIAEASGRRVVWWGFAASLAYLALFGVGFLLLNREISQGSLESIVFVMGAGGFLTILGLYVAVFLAAFLAIIVSTSAVSTDVETGITQAVLVRPLSRTSWYLQRWGALVLLACGYIAVMAGALLLIAHTVSGYRPTSWPALVGLLFLEMTCLVTVGMLASTRLSTMAAGVLLFSWFGLSWLGGFVGYIGQMAQRPALVDVATAVSLIAPSDQLWKAASSYATPASMGAAALAEGFGRLPFSSIAHPTPLFVAWALGFTLLALLGGVLSFRRRDL